MLFSNIFIINVVNKFNSKLSQVTNCHIETHVIVGKERNATTTKEMYHHTEKGVNKNK